MRKRPKTIQSSGSVKKIGSISQQKISSRLENLHKDLLELRHNKDKGVSVDDVLDIMIRLTTVIMQENKRK